MGRKACSLIASLILFLNFPVSVYALEIQISGNGESSNSQVAIATDQTSNVTQSNDIKVENNLNLNSNTGSNAVLSSNGDSNIQTGDSKTQVEVANTGNLNKVVENDCNCSKTQDIEVVGNGESSQQNVKIDSSNQSNLKQNNTATITTNITGNINTGVNKVNGNSGSASISTGNISAKVSVSNKPINQSVAIVSPNLDNSSFKAVVSGNGANSVSVVNVSLKQNNIIEVNNFANIQNNVNLDLNTGFNEIDGSVGDSAIKTGDIFVNVSVENEANSSFVNVNCDCYHISDPVDPSDPSDPNDPGVNNSNSSNTKSNSSVGGVSGASNSSDPSVLGLSFTGIDQNLVNSILFGMSIIFLGTTQLFFQVKER